MGSNKIYISATKRLGHIRNVRLKMKKTVKFEAHKMVKKPTEITFVTKGGKVVDFEAKKNVEVPVHVKFKANK